MTDSPPLGGSGLSDDEDVLDPLIRALGDLDDIDLEIDTKMFDGEGSASSFNFAEAAQDHVAASVAVGATMAASAVAAAAAQQRAPAPAPGPVPAAAAPPQPRPQPQPVPAAAPPPPPPEQPAVDPMAAERAAPYPPPDQPLRKIDWGEENDGAAPKRKSGSQYDIAPVIRRRHSKEEWSTEIDAGDGTRPKRRNSGDARDADWHLKNNMFGDEGLGQGYGQGGGGGGYGGPPQEQQYGQYHEFQHQDHQAWQQGQGQYGQHSYQQQQQQQLPKRRHSGDARSAKWAMKNNMFGDRAGPGFGPGGGATGYHSHADHRVGGPFGGGGGFDTPNRGFGNTMERRRCNSDSKLRQWDDLLHESDDDDFGPEFDNDIARRRNLHGQRYGVGPEPYQPRARSHSDGATTGITPEWAFGHDGDDNPTNHSGGGGGFGASNIHMQAPAPEPFPSTQLHEHQYGHGGAPPSQFNHGVPPLQFNANMYSDKPSEYRKSKSAGGKMPRRYSDSRLKRWDVDDMFNSSDDDSAAGSEPIQPDDIFGPGRGGGGHGGGNRIARRGNWHKRRPFSSAVSDSALDAFSDDDDDSFGEPTPLQRVAAEHFHQYGNDGRDHAQLFSSGIPAYKDDQKIVAPTGMDQGQAAQNDSEDATKRKIAEMKEQIALLQSSMAALESTVQPHQTQQAPQNPPEPNQDAIEPEPVPAAPVIAAPARTGMSTFEAFEAAVAEDDDDDDDVEDDDDDDDDFGEQNTEESPVDPITKLNQLMAKSQQSLKQLQEYDKSQGLPASHSQTMVKSSRSRRQLLEGKIMKKWDGTPMIEFDEQGRVIQQEKKRRSKKDDGKKDDGKKKEGEEKDAAAVVALATEERKNAGEEISGDGQPKEAEASN